MFHNKNRREEPSSKQNSDGYVNLKMNDPQTRSILRLIQICYVRLWSRCLNYIYLGISKSATLKTVLNLLSLIQIRNKTKFYPRYVLSKKREEKPLTKIPMTTLILK